MTATDRNRLREYDFMIQIQVCCKVNDSFYFCSSAYFRYEPLELPMTTTGLKEPFVGARAHLRGPMRYSFQVYFKAIHTKDSVSSTYSIDRVLREVGSRLPPSWK